MTQSTAQSHPMPDQNKAQAPGSKPVDTAVGAKPTDDKVQPNAAALPGSNANTKS